jgi:hypothetical protein
VDIIGFLEAIASMITTGSPSQSEERINASEALKRLGISSRSPKKLYYGFFRR